MKSQRGKAGRFLIFAIPAILALGLAGPRFAHAFASGNHAVGIASDTLTGAVSTSIRQTLPNVQVPAPQKLSFPQPGVLSCSASRTCGDSDAAAFAAPTASTASVQWLSGSNSEVAVTIGYWVSSSSTGTGGVTNTPAQGSQNPQTFLGNVNGKTSYVYHDLNGMASGVWIPVALLPVAANNQNDTSATNQSLYDPSGTSTTQAGFWVNHSIPQPGGMDQILQGELNNLMTASQYAYLTPTQRSASNLQTYNLYVAAMACNNYTDNVGETTTSLGSGWSAPPSNYPSAADIMMGLSTVIKSDQATSFLAANGFPCTPWTPSSSASPNGTCGLSSPLYAGDTIPFSSEYLYSYTPGSTPNQPTSPAVLIKYGTSDWTLGFKSPAAKTIMADLNAIGAYLNQSNVNVTTACNAPYTPGCAYPPPVPTPAPPPPTYNYSWSNTGTKPTQALTDLGNWASQLTTAANCQALMQYVGGAGDTVDEAPRWFESYPMQLACNAFELSGLTPTLVTNLTNAINTFAAGVANAGSYNSSSGGCVTSPSSATCGGQTNASTALNAAQTIFNTTNLVSRLIEAAMIEEAETYISLMTSDTSTILRYPRGTCFWDDTSANGATQLGMITNVLNSAMIPLDVAGDGSVVPTAISTLTHPEPYFAIDNFANSYQGNSEMAIFGETATLPAINNFTGTTGTPLAMSGDPNGGGSGCTPTASGGFAQNSAVNGTYTPMKGSGAGTPFLKPTFTNAMKCAIQSSDTNGVPDPYIPPYPNPLVNAVQINPGAPGGVASNNASVTNTFFGSAMQVNFVIRSFFGTATGASACPNTCQRDDIEDLLQSIGLSSPKARCG